MLRKVSDRSPNIFNLLKGLWLELNMYHDVEIECANDKKLRDMIEREEFLFPCWS